MIIECKVTFFQKTRCRIIFTNDRMKLTSRPFYSDSLPWCVCLSRMRFLIFSTSSKFLRPHPLVANRLAGDCEAKRSTIISERRCSM